METEREWENQAGLVACNVSGCRTQFITNGRHMKAVTDILKHMQQNHGDGDGGEGEGEGKEDRDRDGEGMVEGEGEEHRD